jgi:hypothetical protein
MEAFRHVDRDQRAAVIVEVPPGSVDGIAAGVG